MNNGKCFVKRYDGTEPEVFINHDNICNKNIYKNLVINGYGEYSDNTNFSGFIYNEATNDFKIDSTKNANGFADNYIKVDVNKKYNCSVDAYTELQNETNYMGLALYDIDKNLIDNHHTAYVKNTLTTLEKDLNNGDTIVYLNSVANWDFTSNSYAYSGFIFWNYKDSTGYQYPALTYSRNVYIPTSPFLYDFSNVNKTNNTIKLNSAWNSGYVAKGTQVSQSGHIGGTYRYNLLYASPLTNGYKSYSSTISKVDYSYNETSFRAGTKYIRIWNMFNYYSVSSNLTLPYTYIRNIIIEEDD